MTPDTSTPNLDWVMRRTVLGTQRSLDLDQDELDGLVRMAAAADELASRRADRWPIVLAGAALGYAVGLVTGFLVP